MTSPWDGSTRRGLRIGLACVLAYDALVCGSVIARTAPRPESVAGAGFLLSLGGRPLLVAPVVVVVLVAVAAFAARRRSLLAGAVALGGLGLLSTSLTALDGGASRNFYVAGACLLGWLCGEGYARWSGSASEPSEARVSRLAEAAAAGAFAATYLSAGISKLTAGGESWVSPATLQAVVLTHHPPSEAAFFTALTDLITNVPAVAIGLAIGTLVMQLGAPLWLLGRRLRAAWGSLFLGFHFIVYLLTDIQYVESFFIAALFSFPWPGLFGRADSEPEPAEPSISWGIWGVFGILAALGFSARLVPEALRPTEDPFVGPEPSTKEVPKSPKSEVQRVEDFGPLRRGSSLPGGWQVREIELRRGEARLGLRRGKNDVVVVVTSKPPRREGAFEPEGADIYYGKANVPLSEFKAAGDEIAKRIVESARPSPVPKAVARWLDRARHR